ncbi:MULTISPECIES: MATE family efflux transporter [Halocynthiibacter]|uniref:Multidrug-efflux transporter n=1 Tax=Halocynthiibacter halioticoli TaxID=2986804 RepID=A0AAE3IZG8_9RHOB|nr:MULTISPECIES: MATE family efflux transporter [Halocynthiibacter]MCV6825187.1 MATE family efflux transporter [Halocynthiibacter halioticoli]MCW4058188.1 MATE family efflux transporter [Halocynthiibacter sp. SDUM655004]
MNEATPEITHRRVLNISIPIVISNATVPLLGIVDTGVVGQMGEAAPIGAVGIGAVILTAIYWIFGFLRMGTTGLAGQAMGAKDTEETVAILIRALLIALTAGVVIILFQMPLFAGAFLVSPASPEVESLAREYMQIRVFSAPAMIALYGLTGWLIAAERTRAVLAIQVVMNGLNIVLDFVFVLGFDWGVQGVAFATFIAEWSGCALALWFCRAGFKGTAWRTKSNIFDPQKLKRMMSVNIDIMIRSVLLQMVFLSFMFFAAGLGDVPLAANQILMQFLMVTAYALDGFAFAVEALVAQALGAKSRANLRRAVVLCSGWSFAVCVLLTLAFAIFGTTFIDLMTTAEPVRAEARVYLIYMILAPLTGLGSWILDGVFIGATRTRDMRNKMFQSAIVYVLAAAILVPVFGNHGLWMSLLISFVARALTLATRYPALERGAEEAA